MATDTKKNIEPLFGRAMNETAARNTTKESIGVRAVTRLSVLSRGHKYYFYTIHGASHVAAQQFSK